MQAHGGKVTVASEKDKFSEFTLYIPKEKNENNNKL
jgi:two-component system phosphate regulon sensor histidine kinase PhoR